jgi:hypothetical protein
VIRPAKARSEIEAILAWLIARDWMQMVIIGHTLIDHEQMNLFRMRNFELIQRQRFAIRTGEAKHRRDGFTRGAILHRNDFAPDRGGRRGMVVLGV